MKGERLGVAVLTTAWRGVEPEVVRENEQSQEVISGGEAGREGTVPDDAYPYGDQTERSRLEPAAAGAGTVLPGVTGQPKWNRGLGRWGREVLAGLYDGLSPMLGKEMRSRTRGWRSVALFTTYLLILTGVVVGILWLSLDRSQNIGPEIGLNLYSFFILVMILLLAFIAPAMAAGAISGEKERRTYDLLMVTRASPLGIVLGKWLASVAYLLWLAIAALPVFAVVYLYGGIPARQVGLALLVALVTGMSYGAMGLALSALIKRSQVATIIAIILVFVLLFGTLIGAGFINAMDIRQVAPGEIYQPPGTPWYISLSPLPALTSALPGGDGQQVMGLNFPIVGSLMREIWQELYRVPAAVTAAQRGYGYSTAYVVGGTVTALSYPERLAALPAWVRFVITQVLFLAACLLVAAVAVRPLKSWPWQRR